MEDLKKENELKPKTGVESGNSPPRISENGAPVQTGRGLESVRRAITDAFAKIHQHSAQPHPAQPLPQQPAQVVQQPPPPVPYTEEHAQRFQRRAKRLALDALSSSYASKSPKLVFEIEVPAETLEELLRMLGEEAE